MPRQKALLRRSVEESRRIESLIRAELESGRLGVADVLRSERELAAEHGVSRRTVRRALQQLVAGGYLASQPRGGYRVVGRPGGAPESRTIAFVQGSGGTPWDWTEFNLAVWNGFQRAAAERDCSMLAIGIGDRPPVELARALAGQGVAGAVVDSDDAAIGDALLAAGLVVVPVDAVHPRAASVTQDNFGAAFEAVGRLLARGRRRIAFLGCDYSPNPNRLHLAERLGGWLSALDRAGLEPRREWRLIGRPVAPAVDELVRMGTGPDAPDAAVVLWPDLLDDLGRAISAGELTSDVVVWWGCVPERRARWRARFPSAPVPDGMVWSAEELAKLALARLCGQLDGSGTVAARTLVPVRVVPGENSGDSR